MGLFSFESKQVKEWKKLAKSGDMDAQYHLARAYANGKGASQNMKKAVDYCVPCLLIFMAMGKVWRKIMVK